MIPKLISPYWFLLAYFGFAMFSIWIGADLEHKARKVAVSRHETMLSVAVVPRDWHQLQRPP